MKKRYYTIKTIIIIESGRKKSWDKMFFLYPIIELQNIKWYLHF